MHSTRLSHALALGIGRSRRRVARIVSRALGPAALACVLGCPGLVAAQEDTAAPASEGDTLLILESEPAVLPVSAAEQRRAELKRVLLRGDEGIEMIRERKRPSTEERNALKRELREALRGAYEQRLHAQQ